MKKTIISICLFLSANGLFAQINLKKGDGGLWILDGQKKIAFYQKESMNLERGRVNYLHPLYLPDGTVVTENAPVDHPHHRGVFWAWHQILIDGESVADGWMLKDLIIDVKSVEFKQIDQGIGRLETISLWQSSAWKNGREAFLRETTNFTFYPQSGNYWRIRIDIELKSLADNLQLGGSDDEKGYGGFSVRMRLPDDIRFIGEHGEVGPQTTAVEGGNYMNMTGSIGENGDTGGIMIYAHPEMRSSPQTWILRKKASMQNAVFPGRNPIDLQKDVPLKLSYTLIVYSGKINVKRVLEEVTGQYSLAR